MSYFKAKVHQIRFRLGLCPRPRWGSLQLSPDLLAGFEVLTTKGRDGKEGERWKEWEGGCYGNGVMGRNKGLAEEERDGEGMEGDNGIGPTHLFERGCDYAATVLPL